MVNEELNYRSIPIIIIYVIYYKVMKTLSPNIYFFLDNETTILIINFER